MDESGTSSPGSSPDFVDFADVDDIMQTFTPASELAEAVNVRSTTEMPAGERTLPTPSHNSPFGRAMNFGRSILGFKERTTNPMEDSTSVPEMFTRQPAGQGYFTPSARKMVSPDLTDEDMNERSPYFAKPSFQPCREQGKMASNSDPAKKHQGLELSFSFTPSSASSTPSKRCRESAYLDGIRKSHPVKPLRGIAAVPPAPVFKMPSTSLRTTRDPTSGTRRTTSSNQPNHELYDQGAGLPRAKRSATGDADQSPRPPQDTVDESTSISPDQLLALNESVQNIIERIDQHLGLTRDLAQRVNAQQERIEALEAENQKLKRAAQKDRAYYDDALQRMTDATNKKIDACIKHVNEKADEVLHSNDEIAAAQNPVPGGVFEGPRYTQASRSASVFFGYGGSKI